MSFPKFYNLITVDEKSDLVSAMHEERGHVSRSLPEAVAIYEYQRSAHFYLLFCNLHAGKIQFMYII